jgi:tetratricopeptide (TPR) repeat protein
MSVDVAAQAEAAFQQAFALHRQLRLAEARALYEQTLQLQPQHFLAWHLLGVVALQSNQSERALELLGKAISINPQIAAFHESYGTALAQLKRDEAAIASYDRAIELKADLVDAHYNRGNALGRVKQYHAALASYDKAIEFRPDHADAYNNRGLILARLRRYEAALESYDHAIALNPELAVAHSNRGIVLKELKQLDAALASYDRAIALKADFAEAHSNRGIVLKDLQQLDAALASCNRAILLKADFPEAHSNRGLVLKDLEQLDAALASYDRAIALKGDFAEAYSNRGLVLQDLHLFDAALTSFAQAVAINRDFAAAYFNRAMASLLTGDFESGWRDFEWRWQGAGGPIMARRRVAQPCWLGKESLKGKTILLCSEQGLGDTLQFCRYARLVADLGARVILEVQKPLQSLLTSLEGAAQVLACGEALPEFDYYCPLVSLPLAFKTTLSTIPARVPYLRSDVQKARYWRKKLGEKRRFRVGLVWSGGFRPDQPELWPVNRRRNIPLAKLAPLQHPEVEFYSLQKGQPGESELAELTAKKWHGPPMADFTGLLHDFSDTAAFIEQLDLVISVDTSTAHLAGALGRPVWILNRFDSCWRWLLKRTDSPWYPTVRLYRQSTAGDWDGVVERVRADLRDLRPPGLIRGRPALRKSSKLHGRKRRSRTR